MTSDLVSCPLTHDAGYDGTNSCWATHTGVQNGTGFSEAQILAGKSTLTHVTSDVTITTPGTVISNEWISGCVAIEASNATIRDSLIYTHDTCSGGQGGTSPSALNTGQDRGAPTGTVIEDTTVDGIDNGNGTNGDSWGISLGAGSTCLRCNAHGFAKNYYVNGSPSAPSLVQDSYSHDNASGYTTSTAGNCPHENGIYLSNNAYVTIEHSYSILTGAGQCVTAAINNQGNNGPTPTHDTVNRTYMEGIDGMDLAWGCGSTYSTVSNNAFSSNNGYHGNEYVGSFETQATNPADVGNTWSGNYLAESPSKAAPPPTGNPGTDGC